MLAAIEAGFPQHEIERRAFEHQRAVEAGERVVVGVNRYADASHGSSPPLHRLDPAFEAAQIARLADVRAETGRKQDACRARCARAGRARNRQPDPAILAAVKTRATLGEIADVLRNRFGEFHPRDRCSKQSAFRIAPLTP